MIQGWRRQPMKFPRIQGADIEGGEEDLVQEALIGSERNGSYAEYTTVPAENVRAVENDLIDAELATFLTPEISPSAIKGERPPRAPVECRVGAGGKKQETAPS